MAELYAPSPSEVGDVARSARLRYTHPMVQGWAIHEAAGPPDDWDCRIVLTVPDRSGPSRATPARPVGPVLRPTSPTTTAGADSEEVFACDRLDGPEDPLADQSSDRFRRYLGELAEHVGTSTPVVRRS